MALRKPKNLVQVRQFTVDCQRLIHLLEREAIVCHGTALKCRAYALWLPLSLLLCGWGHILLLMRFGLWYARSIPEKLNIPSLHG